METCLPARGGRPEGPLRVGILLSKLAGNQLGYRLIESASGLSDVDLISFFQNVSRPHRPPPFASMSVTECYDYPGVAVATTLSTASSLLRFPGPCRRFFYVWDLEWMRGGRLAYEEMRGLYGNPRLPLIARSESHREVIERCWNTKVVGIVPDCDLSQLIDFLENHHGQAEE